LCRKNPTPIHPSYTLRALVQEKKAELEKQKKPEPEKKAQISPVLELLLGIQAYRNRNYADAIRHYTDACASDPSAVSYGNRAACYFKLKQYQLALEDYERAESFDKHNPKLMLGKALTLERLGEFQRAFELLQRALQYPNTPQSKYDILSGMKRLLPHLELASTAITTITPLPSVPLASMSPVPIAPFHFETVPSYQWQINQEMMFKEFVGRAL